MVLVPIVSSPSLAEISIEKCGQTFLLLLQCPCLAATLAPSLLPESKSQVPRKELTGGNGQLLEHHLGIERLLFLLLRLSSDLMGRIEDGLGFGK